MPSSMILYSTLTTITVGILCEEVIEKMISTIPILTPFSHILSPVIVGSITAICASLIVYCKRVINPAF